MTKKEFKDRCHFTDYGRGKTKKVAIFFDWLSEEINGKYCVGYKYMVKTSIQNATKAELFNHFYDWVMKQVNLPWWINYRYAENDENRFKVPIVG